MSRREIFSLAAVPAVAFRSEAVFEPAEWKSVYRVVLGQTPHAPPKLSEMIRIVAQLAAT